LGINLFKKILNKIFKKKKKIKLKKKYKNKKKKKQTNILTLYRIKQR